MKSVIPYVILFLSTTVTFGQNAEPLFRFGIVADVQYCDCETGGTRHYRESLAKFQEAVEEFNKHDLEFVASLGDFIDRDFQSFEAVNAIASQLKSPLWHAIGNHEWSVADLEKAQVPSILGLKKRYYSKSLNGWRFIFLDGNAVSLYGAKEGSAEYLEAQQLFQSLEQDKAPNAKTWNGALGTAQLEWVEKELKSATKKKEKVILLCHFPVVPYPGGHNLWDDARVLELIKSHENVVAYFSGHVHKGHYEEVGKVHYVVFDGMVEQDSNAYAIVSVYGDRLEINGFGREQDRVLDLY
ncbi:MAG: metallophosphoesterase [Bacteroidota bacterium]